MNVGKLIRQRCKFLNRFFDCQALAVENFVGSPNRIDDVGGHTTPAHPLAVNCARARRIAFHHYERRHIFDDDRRYRRKTGFTEPAELVHGGESCEDRIIADLDVAGECRVIGENGVVADMAVMRNVAVRHYPVVVAERRESTTTRGATVDTAVLANGIAVTDF